MAAQKIRELLGLARCPICEESLGGHELSRCRICDRAHHRECHERENACGAERCAATFAPICVSCKGKLEPGRARVCATCKWGSAAAAEAMEAEVIPRDGGTDWVGLVLWSIAFVGAAVIYLTDWFVEQRMWLSVIIIGVVAAPLMMRRRRSALGQALDGMNAATGGQVRGHFQREERLARFWERWF